MLKAKEYSVDKYIFKNYIFLDNKEIYDIWNWRNDTRISKWMFHSDLIPFERHLRFIESLKTRNDSLYWLVYEDNIAIGAIYIQDIKVNIGEFGYYVKPGLKGFGFKLVKEGLNFVFNILGFQSVGLSVAINNFVAFALDVFMGFEIDYIKKIECEKDSRTYIFCKQYSAENYLKHKKLSKEDYSSFMNELSENGYFKNNSIDVDLYQIIKKIANRNLLISL